ncbi:Mothers against decapentaplegic-like protein [Ooceraea biroi]|uniref:Mothers against decapentaplegic homolog n=1 Tax=Ooceraea biroi TaxID=2015173 RepID=A0A026WL20_OOCBI|nr:Mothers against decapentaplegic-like protein [Ooceraea biroi]
MFWSKQTVLTRRLLKKAKVRGEHETECEAQEDSSSRTFHRTSSGNSTSGVTGYDSTASNNNNNNNNNNNISTTTTGRQVSRGAGLSASGAARGGAVGYGNRIMTVSSRLHKGCCGGDVSQDDDEQQQQDPARVLRCKELLKTLKENQLEMLLTAVESCGAELGSCVLVPRQSARRPADDHHPYDQQQHAGNSGGGGRPHRHHPRHFHHHRYRHYRHHRSGRHHRSSSVEDEQESCCSASEDSSASSASSPMRSPSDRPCCAGNAVVSSAVRGPAESGVGAPCDPHLLCCQIWRWPDLEHSSELKRLPICHSAKDPVYICCNPYHWSRLCKPGRAPPRCTVVTINRAPGRFSAQLNARGNPPTPMPLPGSLTTNGEAASDIARSNRAKSHWSRAPLPPPRSLASPTKSARKNASLAISHNENSKHAFLADAMIDDTRQTWYRRETGQREWCTLAYWELGGRVGRLYPVEPSTVNVFDSLHDGDGLCLATLAENHNAPPAVQRTRSKIGLGLTLSQEADGVWAYNRSENPIFVNSPTLDDPESRTLLVYRVSPGFCLNIFDRSKIAKMQLPYGGSGGGGQAAGFVASGPVDINSVRISFVKGWGPKYSRQEVTSCPCWLEVLLAPCR